VEDWEKLYKEGKPIKQILDELQISKSTLFRRLKRKGIVRMPGEALKGTTLSKEHKLKIGKSLKGKNTGDDNHRTQKLNDNYDKMTDELAYILGVMFGDGYIMVAGGGIGLQSKDEDFTDEFARCITKQFGTRINRYETKSTILKDWRNGKTYNRNKTFIVRTLSVFVRDFIEKSQKLSVIETLTISQKIFFLRGLWDSEGAVSKSGYTNTVNFTHNTEELCNVFSDLVFELCEFRPKVRHSSKPFNTYVSYFYKKEYIREFFRVVNPTIQRKRDKFKIILN